MFVVSNLLVQVQRIAATDPAAALELCERIAELAGDRDDFHVLHGQLQLFHGDMDGAWVSISRAASLGSNDPACFLALGSLARNFGDPSLVRRCYQIAAALEPASASAYSNLANLRLEIEPAAAEVLIARALSISPDFPEALTNAAALAERQGDLDTAVGYCRTALAKDPNALPALINFGTITYKQGAYLDAEALFTKVLLLAPGEPAALNGLGVALLGQGDAPRAELWFRRAIDVAPTLSEALFNLGSLRQGVGDLAGALAFYQRAESGAIRTASLFNSGVALLSSKQYDEAISVLRQAAVAEPERADIQRQLAQAFIGAGRLPEARAALLNAIVSEPDTPDHYLNFGLAQIHDLPPDDSSGAATALKACARSIRLNVRELATAWCCIGIARVRAGNTRDGVEAFRKAIAHSPEFALACAKLGLALEEMGEDTQARAAHRRAMMSAPADDVALSYADACLRQREYDQANTLARICLAFNPGSRAALSSVASALLITDQPAEAARLYARALAVVPDYTLSHNNLGIALALSDRPDEAMACFTRLLADMPDYAEGHFNLALVHEMGRRLDDAEHCYRGALEHDPAMAKAHNNLGVLLRQQGRFAEALECLNQASGADPNSSRLHNNLGNLHLKLGEVSEALAHYRRAILLDPGYDLGYYNAGATLLEAEDYAGSLPFLRPAFAINPDNLSACYNLACALQYNQSRTEAIGLYRKVLARDPDHYRATNNLALALQSMGETAEALALYQRAEAIVRALGHDALRRDGLYTGDSHITDDARHQLEIQYDEPSVGLPSPTGKNDPGDMFPAAQWNKALLLLCMGDIGAGWDNYEFRWHQSSQSGQSVRRFRQPKWDGNRNIAGKRILIWREQGIGDEILFSSCLPDLLQLGAQVSFECSAKLLPLFRRTFAQARVMEQDVSADSTREDFDIHLPVGSLPRFFRRSLADFPDRKGFLKPDPARVSYWRSRLEAIGPGPYVGMCWRSKMQTLSRNLHYTKIEEWEPILRTPGVTFINMQYDDATKEIALAQSTFGVTIHSFTDIDMWNDLDEVAALIRALDLLISANTSVQMLGGGVGLPTWLFSVRNNSWPCLGTDHWPWFPSIKVFYRSLETSWDTTMEKIAHELREALVGLAGTRPVA